MAGSPGTDCVLRIRQLTIRALAGTRPPGDVTMPEGAQTVYTPLLTNLHLHYYNVKMEGITVGGQALSFDSVRPRAAPSP